MKKFNIKVLCSKCEGSSFELHDTIQAKEKNVLELGRQIAAQGFVNTSAFKMRCVTCATDVAVKLEYKPKD